HLLIVGDGSQGEQALRDQALRALKGRPQAASPDRFQTNAFREGVIHGPLCEDVREWNVRAQLIEIKKAISRRRNAPDAPNAVVLIYIQGGEWVEQKGRPYLQFRRQGIESGAAFPIDDVIAILKDVQAARVLMMDVARHADAKPVF